jgi:hypothetical protein
MPFETAAIAILWGGLSGYLLIRLLDNLSAIVICLHGLLMTRWQKLASKASTGRVKSETILRVLLRVSLYALFCLYLLHAGFQYTRQELWFDHGGDGAILFAVVAALIALSRVPAVRRRLLVIWKMTHEFDYADKRQRTFLLKR